MLNTGVVGANKKKKNGCWAPRIIIKTIYDHFRGFSAVSSHSSFARKSRSQLSGSRDLLIHHIDFQKVYTRSLILQAAVQHLIYLVYLTSLRSSKCHKLIPNTVHGTRLTRYTYIYIYNIPTLFISLEISYITLEF